MKKQKKQRILKNKKICKLLKKLGKVIKSYFASVNKLNKDTIMKIRKILFLCMSALIIATGFAACNATRTITTTQTHIKGQDTVVTMTTQTKETYDATIKPKNMF